MSEPVMFQGGHKLHCPKCKRDTDQHIRVYLGGVTDGTYCLWCFADWIKQHIPQMQSLQPDPGDIQP